MINDMKVLFEKIKAIVDPSLPLVSNLSNVSALLNELKDLNWCGFYLRKDDYLYLGPFQGEVACTLIPLSKGVCGHAAITKQTVIVPDVNLFSGHIACSSASKSEIVTPIIKNQVVVAVIDLDSPIHNRFNKSEALLLESVADLLKDLF